MFVSQLPDWHSGLFVACASLLVLVLVAYRFTSQSRRDPPPALRADGE